MTYAPMPPPAAPRPGRDRPVTELLVRLALAFVTPLLGWIFVLGWHAPKTEGPDGLQGPYSTGQVAAYVLLMGVACLVASVSTRVDLVLTIVPALATTTGLVLVFSADAATTRYDDGLWPIGALSLLVGGLLGFLVVGGVATAISALVAASNRRLHPDSG